MSNPVNPKSEEHHPEEARPRDPNVVHVTIKDFDGPLDLLLHLIQKHELDIIDIPIGFVTAQYLNFIDTMVELNIDIASDYLVMAATLAHIKSRMLLPQSPTDDTEEQSTEEEDSDPRAELVRRLLEYQKYKHAAESLVQRDLLGRDTFGRGTSIEISTGPAPLAPPNLFKLVDAFQRILDRNKLVVEHHIDFEEVSITERVAELSEKLRELGRTSFDSLFEGVRTRYELVVTFLALLEMAKLQALLIIQDGPLEPLYVELMGTVKVSLDGMVELEKSYLHRPEDIEALQEVTETPEETEDGEGFELEPGWEEEIWDFPGEESDELEEKLETDPDSSLDSEAAPAESQAKEQAFSQQISVAEGSVENNKATQKEDDRTLSGSPHDWGYWVR